MAGRSRRHVKPLDYRRLHLIGLGNDSSEDEGSEEDDEIPVLAVSDEEDDNSSDSGSSDSELESEEESSAEEATDTQFYGQDGTEWQERPIGRIPDWRTTLRNFGDGPTGLAKETEFQTLTKSEILSLMLTEDVLSDICKWPNLLGEHTCAEWNSENPNALKKRQWSTLTLVELRGFIGLILLAGIEKPRKKPWSELWNKSPTIKCLPFPATMSRNRFFNLLSMLRFDDAIERRERHVASANNPDVEYDKLEPISQVFSDIVETFSLLYVPGSKLCVDEQLIKFRGNCPFRVYMPAKPGKYGIKIWALVDDSSGYILNLQIYQGKVGSTTEIGQGKRVVLDLTEKYFGTQRGIVADNFFTSMDLLKELLDQGLSYCGTLRKNRLEVPPVMKDISGSGEGSHYFLFNKEASCTLVRYVPKKNRYVLLLSSAHFSPETVRTKKGKEKPSIVDYYNAIKGGVDTADLMLSTYTCQFPTKRWPLKVFLHLVDSAALNSYIIWSHNNPHWMDTVKSRRRHFIRQLAYDLIMPQIRQRLRLLPSIHQHVREAMEAMGVEVTTSAGSPISSGDERNADGKDRPQYSRCSFDKGEGKQPKTSRTKCGMCPKFMCLKHKTVVCPDCCQRIQSRPE